MTTARSQLVSIDATPYYHCVSRCVRRCFLCGEDKETNISYEHRREWIECKIQALSHLYCIDICAYAIMSNHYHLVLHINRDQALKLTQLQIIERWKMAHKLPVLVERYLNGQHISSSEQEKCSEIIEQWRDRLWSMSWFMKELNYDIACRANQEDNCTGHFWESRFKSQALLDEKALVAAMAYVDLNPIRAGIATTPEQSEFTSIKVRIKALKRNQEAAPCLHPFIGEQNPNTINCIPFSLSEYIEVVDWTAREFREGKASMSQSLPPIIKRLNLERKNWLTICTQLEKKRSTAIGSSNQLMHIKACLNKSKVHIYRI